MCFLVFFCGVFLFVCFSKRQMHLAAMNPYFVVADVFCSLSKAELVPPSAVLLAVMASSAL